MKCLIVAPDYAHGSAGVFALHYLMHLLGRLGDEVHTTAKESCFPGIQMYQPNAAYDMVLVPEGFRGGVSDGPLVRWCLNKPGLLSGPGRFGPNEIVFHYDPDHEALARAAAHDGASELFFLPCLRELPDPRKNKDLVCWYQGKFAHTPSGMQVVLDERCVPDGDAIRITKSWPVRKEETAALLNRCRTFYSFDDYSSTNLEAHCLGARVLLADLTPSVGYSPPAVAGEAFAYRWKEYTPPPDPGKYFMSRERDLATVRVFRERFKERACALMSRPGIRAGEGK